MRHVLNYRRCGRFPVVPVPGPRGEDDQPDRLGPDDVPRVPGWPRAAAADGLVRHAMRMVPVLCDAGVRESARDPVRLDAILPRPPEWREATDGGRPGFRAAVDRRPGSHADSARNGVKGPRIRRRLDAGAPDHPAAVGPSVRPLPLTATPEIVEWRCGCCGIPGPGGPGVRLPLRSRICGSCHWMVCRRCALDHRRNGCDGCRHSFDWLSPRVEKNEK